MPALNERLKPSAFALVRGHGGLCARWSRREALFDCQKRCCASPYFGAFMIIKVAMGAGGQLGRWLRTHQRTERALVQAGPF